MSQSIIMQLNGPLGDQLYQYAAGRALSATLGGRLSLAPTEGIDYRPILFQKSVPEPVGRATAVYAQKMPTEPWTPDRLLGTDVLFCIGQFQYVPALKAILPFLTQELLVALHSIRQQLITKYTIQMRKRAAFVYVTRDKPQDYYESVIAGLNAKKSMHVYILSEDLAWCRSQPWLQGYTLVDEPELHALAFMSLCEGGAEVSGPLSWWGSLLAGTWHGTV